MKTHFNPCVFRQDFGISVAANSWFIVIFSAGEWMVLAPDSARVVKCGYATYVTLNGVSTDRRIQNYSPC